MKTEEILQAEIYKWYHNNYCTKFSDPQNIIFSVPNGGYRTKSEAMRLKATGLLAGVSDLIILRKNEVIFVELKTATGKQSKEQKSFQEKVTKLGFKYYIVRSLVEFKSIIY
jgi:hypothetical protein